MFVIQMLRGDSKPFLVQQEVLLVPPLLCLPYLLPGSLPPQPKLVPQSQLPWPAYSVHFEEAGPQAAKEFALALWPEVDQLVGRHYLECAKMEEILQGLQCAFHQISILINSLDDTDQLAIPLYLSVWADVSMHLPSSSQTILRKDEFMARALWSSPGQPSILTKCINAVASFHFNRICQGQDQSDVNEVPTLGSAHMPYPRPSPALCTL